MQIFSFIQKCQYPQKRDALHNSDPLSTKTWRNACHSTREVRSDPGLVYKESEGVKHHPLSSPARCKNATIENSRIIYFSSCCERMKNEKLRNKWHIEEKKLWMLVEERIDAFEKIDNCLWNFIGSIEFFCLSFIEMILKKLRWFLNYLWNIEIFEFCGKYFEKRNYFGKTLDVFLEMFV